MVRRSSSWMPYAPQGIKGTDDDDVVRTHLYIFAQNNILGIQLHVSALYIGHREVVL